MRGDSNRMGQHPADRVEGLGTLSGFPGRRGTSVSSGGPIRGSPIEMNDAAKASCQTIEKALQKSSAFRKVDEGLYVVKQGSSLVMINVLAWNPDRAVVRCVAQLVKGVTMEVPLALQLLEMNALLRFGAFAYVPAGDVIIFSHTLLGGATLRAEELNTTIRDVAIIADEYDDRIAARYGGQTMQELLEESVIDHFRTAPGKDPFKP